MFLKREFSIKWTVFTSELKTEKYFSLDLESNAQLKSFLVELNCNDDMSMRYFTFKGICYSYTNPIDYSLFNFPIFFSSFNAVLINIIFFKNNNDLIHISSYNIIQPFISTVYDFISHYYRFYCINFYAVISDNNYLSVTLKFTHLHEIYNFRF